MTDLLSCMRVAMRRVGGARFSDVCVCVLGARGGGGEGAPKNVNTRLTARVYSILLFIFFFVV